MKSYLSGNPEIRLALNDDLSIGRGIRSTYGIAGQHRNIFQILFGLCSLILSGCSSDMWIIHCLIVLS